MKKFLLSLSFVFFACSLFAQLKDPVQWSYTAVKKSDKVYDLVITAVFPEPWHLYSSNTPAGGPVATKVVLKNNPLVTPIGKLKENGKLKKEKDNIFKVDVLYYANKVEFIQTVQLKANVKTNISGTVEYMVCNDDQCLPPTKKTFDIKL